MCVKLNRWHSYTCPAPGNAVESIATSRCYTRTTTNGFNPFGLLWLAGLWRSVDLCTGTVLGAVIRNTMYALLPNVRR